MVSFVHNQRIEGMFMGHRVEKRKGIWHVYRCMGNLYQVCVE